MSELRFDGKSVIVTGAGRGFGRSHALLLASRGAKVVVADNGCEVDGSGSSHEPAQQTVKEIEAGGGEAVACFESVCEPPGVIGHIPKCIAYAGAKGGVFAFTRALALDGRRSGLRVNAVAPRGTTRISDAQALSRVYDAPAEMFENPFMDGLKPEFVSPGAAYLAHESCPLTGEVLVCGGGTVSKMMITKSLGATFKNITPEDIAENIDRIIDPEGMKVQTLDTME